MGTGIALSDITTGASGTGSFSGVTESGPENPGDLSFPDNDVFTYNADIGTGEFLTFSGEFFSANFEVDNQPYVLSNAPSFGTLNFNVNDGSFTYTVTRAELDANGGNQTISFNVQGLGDPSLGPVMPATLDTDTVQFAITCFAKGTRIATPAGEKQVQNLQIGDLIRTADGGDVAVKWIGTQRVSTLFSPADRLMPVRFAAGSLGHGLPHSDLTVTADHAMLVDGVLCNAGALINGTTIARVPLGQMGTQFDIYHIETEAHEIILANGAPAETFIDNVSRSVFDNFADYVALYGDEREMLELPLPRALSARQVPAPTRNRLAERRVA